MPTYLRWIAAISTGITVQLIFTLATYPLAGETVTDDTGTSYVQLTNVMALLLPLTNLLVAMIASLWINDWIQRRYPREPR